MWDSSLDLKTEIVFDRRSIYIVLKNTTPDLPLIQIWLKAPTRKQYIFRIVSFVEVCNKSIYFIPN